MRRAVVLLAFVLTSAACSGGSDPGPEALGAPDSTDTTAASDGQSAGDGTRLLVAGVAGIDLVDLDAETQEPFIGDLGQITNLRLVGGVLWFTDGTDLVAADPASGELKGRVTVPDGVHDLVAAGNTAWGLTGFPGASAAVAVIDTDTMTLLGSVAAPESTTYSYVAVLGDDAWAFGGDIESATAVSKLDATTLEQSTVADTGLIANSMAGGAGGIWIGGTIPAFSAESGNPESGIVQIDSETGAVITTIPLGEPRDHIVVAVGLDHLWATKGLDGTLYKIDPATGETVASIDTGDGAAGIPLEIIFAADLIWIFNTTDDTVTGYDPETLEVKEGFTVPTFAGAPIFAP